MLLKIIVLSILLSIDALGIGMSYQLRGIKVNGIAKFIVGLMATGVAFLAIFIGKKAIGYFPTNIMEMIGTTLLCILGILFIYKSLYEEEKVLCDIDHSSSIGLGEAVLLGITLSLDSVTVGVAVATIGMNELLLPVLVGFNHFLFLIIGEWLGSKTISFSKGKQKICGICSGLFLIFIAILQNLG